MLRCALWAAALSSAHATSALKTRLRSKDSGAKSEKASKFICLLAFFPQEEKMIALHQVSKMFSGNKAVDSVTFTAVPGRVMGLIGSNGSGKSTTMRLISTVLKQDSGSIEVSGFDTIKYPKAVRKKIGTMLGGDVCLYPRLTARENIRYYADLQNVSCEDYRKTLDFLVETLMMSSFLDKRVCGFSRGMRQKVAFARSMIHSPDIMLLDEPSTGLDIISINEVQKFIVMCKNLGKTILLTSHNSSEIDNLCDDIVVLDEGKVIEFGNKDGLLGKYGTNSSMELFERIMKGQ